jgi:hypothetical protein
MNNDQQNYWQADDEQDNDTPPTPPVAESPTPLNEQPAQPALEQPTPTEQAPVSATQAAPQQAAPAVPEAPEEPPVTWTAQEYVHPEKGSWWYVIFVIAVLGLIAIDVFLLKSWTFSILVVVMAVALVVYIRRPPRDLTYALSKRHGLYVGEKLYNFEDFKSFGLIRDGNHYSIMLIPRKRFAPGVSVYFPAEAGEKIVDVLGQRLPMQELKLDAIDLVVRKLRL